MPDPGQAAPKSAARGRCSSFAFATLATSHATERRAGGLPGRGAHAPPPIEPPARGRSGQRRPAWWQRRWPPAPSA